MGSQQNKVIHIDRAAFKRKAKEASGELLNKAVTSTKESTKKVAEKVEAKASDVKVGILSRAIEATKKQLKFLEKAKKKS